MNALGKRPGVCFDLPTGWREICLMASDIQIEGKFRLTI